MASAAANQAFSLSRVLQHRVSSNRVVVVDLGDVSGLWDDNDSTCDEQEADDECAEGDADKPTESDVRALTKGEASVSLLLKKFLNQKVCIYLKTYPIAIGVGQISQLRGVHEVQVQDGGSSGFRAHGRSRLGIGRMVALNVGRAKSFLFNTFLLFLFNHLLARIFRDRRVLVDPTETRSSLDRFLVMAHYCLLLKRNISA